MSLAVFDAESGTDNTTLTTGNTGFANVTIGVGGTATFEATGALFGSLSYQLVQASGTTTNFRVDPAGLSSAYRTSIAFSVSALPAAGQTPQMFYWTNTANGAIIALVALNSLGQLVVQCSGSTVLTSTLAIVPGTVYLLDVVMDVGTTTSNGRFGMGCVALGTPLTNVNGSNNAYYYSAAANLGTTGIGRQLMGKMSATWAVTQRIEFATDDTTDFTSDPATWLQQFSAPPAGTWLPSGSGTASFSGSAPYGGSAPVTFVAAGTTGVASGPSGVATAGLPAGVQAGDVLVMVVGTSRGAASGSATFSASTLWQSFQTRGANNGSTNTAVNWSTRVYVPGDPSTYTATLAAGEAANTAITAFILAFRNVDPSSLTWMGGISSGSASSSAVAATDVIPPTSPIVDNHDGAMALALVSALGTGGPYGIPTNWSQAKQDETALGPIGNSLSAFYRAYDPGVTATDAVTVSGTSSTKLGHQIVLNAKRPPQGGVGVRVRSATNHSAYWSTATMPANKPLGTQTGELMVAVAAVDNAGLAADLVAPVGWTEFANGSVTGAAGAGYYKAWYRYAVGGEPTSYTWNKGTDGYGIIGIVTFIEAGVPSTITYTATGTASGTPALDQLAAGAVGAQLLAFLLVGTGTDAYRSLTTPSGTVEWADSRPSIQGGWNVLGMWTKALTSTAATGTVTSTLLTQTSSIVAPASGATGSYAGAQVLVPSGTSGTIAASGSGSLSFGTAAPTPAVGGSLALSGSGGLAFGTRTPAVNGSFAASGSGSLSLGGVATPGSSVQFSGAGSLTFPTTRPGGKGTLAFSGTGTALFFGGGGAGLLQTTGNGTLTFPVLRAGAAGPLTLAGAGSLVLVQVMAGLRGTLARTGGGTVSFTQANMSARGSMARTGLGTMIPVMALISMRLQGWDSALGQWRPLLVRGWDSENGWRFVAAYRRKTGTWN